MFIAREPSEALACSTLIKFTLRMSIEKSAFAQGADIKTHKVPTATHSLPGEAMVLKSKLSKNSET
jgi:hypothetical protein